MKKNISIAAVAASLKEVKSFLDKEITEIDVRLQFRPDDGGVWNLHTGDPQYDQDHRGHWGSGYVSSRTNCRELAKDLISQVDESLADLEACKRLKRHEEEMMSSPHTCPCGSGLTPVDVGVNAPLLLCDHCFDQACVA